MERRLFLLQRLTLHIEPEEKFISAFLKPPLYSTAYSVGFGTLYTAIYKPKLRKMEIRWPGSSWKFNLKNFVEESRWISTPEGQPSS